MDLVCCGCGEPWALDYVLHDEPEGFTRDGAAIVACPCCGSRDRQMSAEEKERLDAARELGTLLGGDVDGYAAELEDLGLT